MFFRGCIVLKKYIDMFFRFFRVGALTFGGGLAMLPIIERELTEGENALMTKEQIADNYAIAQCVPGIIAVNTSIISGYQIGGTAGGLVSAFGVCAPSFIIIFIIASVLSGFMDNSYVLIALAGIRSGVCALILNTVFNLAKKNIVDKLTLAIFFLAFGILLFVDVSPVIPIVIGAAIGVLAKRKGGENK